MMAFDTVVYRPWYKVREWAGTMTFLMTQEPRGRPACFSV